MDFGKLPTDNVYKFIAISGVALAIVSFIWPIQIAKETSDKVASMEHSLMEQMATVDSIVLAPSEQREKGMEPGLNPNLMKIDGAGRVKWDKYLYDKQIYLVKAIARLNNPSPEVLKEFEFERVPADELPSRIKATVDRLRTHRETTRNVVFDIREVWRLVDYSKWTQTKGRIGILVGSIIAAIGFGLWYFKVQIFQDRILAKEANKP